MVSKTKRRYFFVGRRGFDTFYSNCKSTVTLQLIEMFSLIYFKSVHKLAQGRSAYQPTSLYCTVHRPFVLQALTVSVSPVYQAPIALHYSTSNKLHYLETIVQYSTLTHTTHMTVPYSI